MLEPTTVKVLSCHYYLPSYLLYSVRGVNITACVCVCVHAKGELENKTVASFAHKTLILMDNMSRS